MYFTRKPAQGTTLIRSGLHHDASSTRNAWNDKPFRGCATTGLPLMPPSLPGPGSRADQTLSLNMRLIAHHELQGFGGIGEGMALQLAGDRRILWLAHESAPKNFTGVDVTHPRPPRRPGAGRWWLPGTREGDEAPPPQRLDPKFDAGFRAHNTNVFPQRPDRAYVGYIDGGAVILDIADKAHPRLVGRWQNSPPFNGFTHTVLPLFDRNLLIVSDECIKDNGFDWPKLVWVLDARMESNPVPISTLPPAPQAAFARRGGRFGAHNLHENLPVPT